MPKLDERRNLLTTELIDIVLAPIPLHEFEDPGYAFCLDYFKERQKK